MRKWLSLIASIVAFLILPVLFLFPILSYSGPGSEFFWVILSAPSGLQFLPDVLFAFLPLLIPLFNTLHPGKKLPRPAVVLQSLFFASWLGLSLAMPIGSWLRPEWIGLYIYGAKIAAAILMLAYTAYTITRAVQLRRQGQKPSKAAVVTMSILVITIVGGGSIYFSIDNYYQGRYNAVKSNLQSIEARSILPAGGKPWENPQYIGYKRDRGNGLGNLQYCATNSCPNVARSWLIPIEPGKEYEFIKNIALQNGFDAAIDKSRASCEFDVVGVSSSTCVAEGANRDNKLYMVLRLEKLDMESLRTTYAFNPNLPKMPDMPDLSPKVWLDLEINLTRTWGN
jgi:hypothetical protein